jgi:hypothetical protein
MKKILIIIPIFCFGLWDVDIHSVNNWVLDITNYGPFGLFEGIWTPESIPFIGAGPLFGMISAHSDTCVTVGYGASSSEYGPGLRNQNHQSPIVRIFMHPYDWPPPLDTYPMAPQTPFTCEESWSCYNDFDTSLHIPGDGKPIGIEIYQTTFADTLVIIKDVIFIKYEIKNCTTYTIDNAIVTILWNQNMVEWNGFILHKWFYPTPNDSFLVEDLGYCYDDSSAIGVLFIKTPDDNGCSAYKTYDWAIMPNNDFERYLVMAGYNYQTGVYDPYDSLGAAEMAFMSSGPFSLNVGETKELVIAIIAAPYINSDTLLLALAARNAKDFYSQLDITEKKNSQQNRIINTLKLSVMPNVTTNNIEIQWMVANKQHIRLVLYDIVGRKIAMITEGIMEAGTYSYKFATTHLNSGVYFLILEGEKETRTKKILIVR